LKALHVFQVGCKEKGDVDNQAGQRIFCKQETIPVLKMQAQEAMKTAGNIHLIARLSR
jgi:hypothetical protein